MSDYLIRQIAAMRAEIADLRRGRVTHKTAQIASVDPTAGTVTVDLPDGQQIAGLPAPAQLLPAVGQFVRIRLDGATPVYEAAGISENAVTTREIAPGAVAVDQLAFDLADYTGGTTVFYGTATPTATGVGDLWLKELDPGPPAKYETRRWDGDSWELLADQGATDALLAAEAAQAAATQRAKLFTQTEAPTGLGADDKAIWVDSNDGNVSYTWSGTAWVKRQIGNAAIQPNSLVASDVIATGTVSAALLEAILVLATEIIAGDPDGYHARLSPTGFRSFAPAPSGGVYEATRLGTGGQDRLGIADAAGNTLAAIDQAGVLAAQGISSVAEPTFAGSTLSQWLAPYSELVSRWGSGNAPSARSTGPEVGYGEVLVSLRQGRRYCLRTSHMRMNGSVDGQEGCVYVRYTDTAGVAIPATPSTTSPLMTRVFVPVPYGIAGAVPPISRLFETPAGSGYQSYRFLLSHSLIQGAGDVYLDHTTADPIQMWFEDQGPAAVQNLTYNGGGGGSVVAPAPMRQTLEYASAWSRTFRQDGSYWSDNGDAYQGYGDSFNGNQASMIGWNDWTGTLSGATVERVEVYLYAHHWWEGDGGTAIIGVHGHTGPPTGLSLTQADIMRVSGWKRGEPKWFTLPSSFNDGFRTGNYRGVLLGPAPSNAAEYYGKFAGGTNALMRITFVK